MPEASLRDMTSSNDEDDYEMTDSAVQEKNEVNILDVIIDKQKSDGNFEWTERLESEFGITSENPGNVKDGDWITALVVAVLKVKFPKDKVIWDLMVKKAVKALAKSLGGDQAKVDNLMAQANERVTKSK